MLVTVLLLLLLLLILHSVDDFVGNPKVFDIVSLYIYFGKLDEVIALWTCLDDLFQGQVHPCVALDQVPVQGLSVFQLHKHGMALGTIQQAEGKHHDDK